MHIYKTIYNSLFADVAISYILALVEIKSCMYSVGVPEYSYVIVQNSGGGILWQIW